MNTVLNLKNVCNLNKARPRSVDVTAILAVTDPNSWLPRMTQFRRMPSWANAVVSDNPQVLVQISEFSIHGCGLCARPTIQQ